LARAAKTAVGKGECGHRRDLNPRRRGALRLDRSCYAYELVAQAFLAHEAHQPLAATSLPPKTEQGPLASPGLPV